MQAGRVVVAGAAWLAAAIERDVDRAGQDEADRCDPRLKLAAAALWRWGVNLLGLEDDRARRVEDELEERDLHRQ